ncbi:MAG TPA: NUDIX hydrolase [Anaerolineae bacterium]|nr:NUDIX hydrolase [Anaerolineae bacterium]
MITFQDSYTLQQWLNTHNIDTAEWGSHNAKTIHNLWQEIIVGESHFEAESPVRHVNVVNIILRHKQQILIEVAQELRDGRVRRRNRPPAEKIMRGENYLEAATRCLVEELGLSAEDIQLDPSSHRSQSYCSESLSYPNLFTHFHLHTIEATIKTLPTNDFRIPHHTHNRADPVVAHHWAWREPTDELVEFA